MRYIQIGFLFCIAMVAFSCSATDTGSSADLSITSLEPQSSAGPGQPFSVQVTVTNKGGGSAGAFSLEGWLFAESNYQYSVKLSPVQVSGLKAGESATRMMTATLPGDAPSGTYDLKVIADNSNYTDAGAVTESNENNNEKWARGLGATPVSTQTPVPATVAPSATPSQFSSGNIYGVQNKPSVPVTVTFTTPVRILSLQNYHWNNAQGKTPGLVGLKGSDNTPIGPWQATGSPGQGGVPDAYWTAKPGVVIPAGTYTVTDSDPETWATNEQNGNRGMSIILYELVEGESSSPQTTPTSSPPVPSRTSTPSWNSEESDLAVTAVTGPKTATVGSPIDLSITITNLGPMDAPISDISIFLIDQKDQGRQYLIGSTQTTQKPVAGRIGIAKRQITLPLDIPAGTYYLAAIVDPDKKVSDPDRSNNGGTSSPAGITIWGGATAHPVQPTAVSPSTPAITPQPSPQPTVAPVSPTPLPSPEETQEQPTASSFVPHADWTYTAGSLIAPAPIQFIQISQGPDDAKITSRTWEFGDGESSTEKDPLHTFKNPGNYTITQTLYAGNAHNSKTGTIEILERVTVDFVAEPTQGTPPLTVHFTDLSKGTSSQEWTFYGQERSTEKNPTYTFNYAGIYSPRLQAFGKGGMDTQTRTDYIIVRPRVDFTADLKEGNASLKVTFTPDASYSTDRGQPTFTWDFGDGDLSAETFPTHTYKKAGKFSVSLTIKGVEGTETEKKENYITVYPRAHYVPETSYGWAPHTIHFSDYSTGEPDSYLWDFKDGTTSTEKSPTHTYEKAGEYVPSLTVTKGEFTDTLDMIGHCCSPGNVDNGAIVIMPVANFTPSVTSGSAPLTVSFTDMSRGSPGEVIWDFGDGTDLSREKEPEHTFEKAGTYNVTQTVQAGVLRHTRSVIITVTESMVTVTVSGGPGGSITPNGEIKVQRGSDQKFTITPDPGYECSDLLVNKKSVGSQTSYTLPQITEDAVISATFRKIPEKPASFTISPSVSEGGSLSPDSPVNVNSGESKTFTLTPDEGYEVAKVTVDGRSVQISGNVYTFSAVNADHTIDATFTRIPVVPTVQPTAIPSATQPTVQPTAIPSTTQPTVQPTAIPSTTQPTVQPTAIPSTTQPTVQPTAIPSTTQPDKTADMKQEVLDLINAERISRGLPAYTHDTALDAVAQYHSNTGATKGWKEGTCTKGTWQGSCAHLDWDGRIPNDRATLLNYPIPSHALDGGCSMSFIGENCFQTTQPDTAVIPKNSVDAWMKSQGHRAAILDSPAIDNGNSGCSCNGKKVSCMFTKIGIGITKSTEGKWYITTNFA